METKNQIILGNYWLGNLSIIISLLSNFRTYGEAFEFLRKKNARTRCSTFFVLSR